MARWSNQVWLTSVLEDEAVTDALVLAKSLLKTRSNRKLAAITSTNVSVENRGILQQVFDMVFLLHEENFAKPVKTGKLTDAHAKAYAFSLTPYQKCVYISPTTLFLENADIMFDRADDFQVLVCPNDEKLDLSIFVLQPSKQVWTTLSNSEISEEYLRTWLKNQKANLKMDVLPSKLVSKFCLSTGKLLSDNTHTPIVQFENLLEKQDNLKINDRLTRLLTMDIGLAEQVIANKWLNLHTGINKLPMQALNLNMISSPVKPYKHEPIAIVGMSCRYPGANNLEEFWNLLYAGEEGIREPPAFRWKKEHSLRVTPEDRKTQAGFLSMPVDGFDAGFFGLSPKEVVYMDPQNRIMHEVLWESLEDAGINPLSLYGTHVAIFTGSWTTDYKEMLGAVWDEDVFRASWGNNIGAAAARLSHLLGGTGPSIATESACSSSMVALHMAVKSLRAGDTNLALAGGVNLLLHPFNTTLLEVVLAPNGRCKTFDAKADGFGRAEGCGVLVLKRLSDALRDRNNIRAVIRGSAMTQEGVSRTLGRPTVQCEALAMRLALEDANISPEQVSFVEAHGTGTKVGDPLEAASISKAYYTPNRKEPLIIGSVKTNVGHTESCSGITGVMKTVLALQQELIPKHRNLEELNPEIFLDSIPAVIPMENVPWPRVLGQIRICGVNSFGITGTNGHVIIEEAPDYELPKHYLGLERPTHLMTISAKSMEAFQELLKKYEDRFSEMDDKGNENFANVAYSANVGRASFAHRTFLVASNFQDGVKIIKYKKYLQAEVSGDRTNSQICFLFTGQGSQYQGMAKSLYETSPIFRVTFDRCDRALKKLLNISIRQIIWTNSDELSRTIYSQTSIFCVEYCLLKLWESWGIKPDYVLGHSLGEFCAAVTAGVLSFEDALKLVAERSRLIDSLPTGSMLVIKANKSEVEKWMQTAKIDLDFAAFNSLDQTVVAGDTKVVEDFLAYLKGQGIKAIILEATHAFHSRHMDPMLEGYRKVAESVTFKPINPNVQYISGMEGRLIEGHTELGADYWVRHTREKVSFIEACRGLRESGCQHYLEVGPQPVLSSFLMQNIEEITLNCLPSLRKGTNDWETILTSLGKLYLLGYQVDWKGYDEPYIRKMVSLPFHPFHRKSYWVENKRNSKTIIHPLIGSLFSNASAVQIFQHDFLLKSVPYLKDHCIGNRIIFPGAGFTEMCLSAGYCASNGFSEIMDPPTRSIRIENINIEQPLELKKDKACRFQAIVDLNKDSKDSSTFRVQIFHQNSFSTEEQGKWVLHASSTFVPVASSKECLSQWNSNRISEIISSTEPTSPNAFYKTVHDTGLRFGENFRMIRRYWFIKQQNCKLERDEVVAEIQLPKDWKRYLLHPLIIDAAFQTGTLAGYRYSPVKLKVPIRLSALTLLRSLESCEISGSTLYLHVWTEQKKTFLCMTTANWTPIAFAEDLELLDSSVKTIESVLEQQSRAIPDCWEESWKILPTPWNTQAATLQTENIFSETELLEMVAPFVNNSDLEKQFHNKTRSLVHFLILNSYQQLGWTPKVGQEITTMELCKAMKILPKFKKLVEFHLSVFEEEAGLVKYFGDTKWLVLELPPSNDNVTREIGQLTEELKANEHIANMTSNLEYVGKNMPLILTGNMSANKLIYPSVKGNNCFSKYVYYKSHPGLLKAIKMATEVVLSTIFQKIETVTQNAGTDKGIYRVLEVGAGSGTFTSNTLTKLRKVWGTRLEYFCTQVLPDFLENAKKEYESFGANMVFQIYNVEESPLIQGIPLGYFDLVCGSNVLHDTRNMTEALAYLRQTLRPGGVICFTETVMPARDATFVFGLLEDSRRFEDPEERRTDHCCMNEEFWQQILLENGFKDFHSFKVYDEQFACLTAVADSEVDCYRVRGLWSTETQPIWVLFADEVNKGLWVNVANNLVLAGINVILIAEYGIWSGQDYNLRKEVTLQVIEHIEQDKASFQISTILRNRAVQGVLYGWGMNTKEVDQRKVAKPFLQVCKTLLSMDGPPILHVVTQGVHAVTEDAITCHPTAATLLGMIKSLKNECFDMFVRIVDLEYGSTQESMTAQILYELAMHKRENEDHRVQVAYRGGLRYEPKLGKCRLSKQNDELKLPASTDRYHLKLPESKLIWDLEFEPLVMEPVGETEIEVKVKAFALNFRDIFAIIKPSKEFEKLNGVGLDFAGVVTKVGKDSKWKVGQRVFGYNQKDEQLPSHLVLESKFVTKIPDQMTYWEAATLPAVFCTAYYCLITVAQMKKGDKVLIHTGSGGVGLAAIQLAKQVGAEIFATAGNARKRAYLRRLGIEHVFHSRNTSYEQDILRVTNGQGVNVVLNSITGPGMKEATLRATAQNGRFVEMSKLSIWTPEEVKTLRADVEYSVVDLTSVDDATSKKLLELTTTYLENGMLKPVPFVKFDALRIRQALQYLQKASHIGKVVVSMPEISREHGQFQTLVPLFNNHSTYLITGGLGGIGFEVCKWMIGLGATDILLTGRSSPKPEIDEQIKQLQEKGVNIRVILGDIGNRNHCSLLMNEIFREMKPLRGVMHCAGVLRDNVYANQTWDAFQATFTPKVQGTWNLHELTKHLLLEHFVVYSSVTALIGTPGQSNHAAANCFEDAFIHYRHSMGLPGLSINWGQWAQVGCARELNVPGLLPVSVKRMLKGLETAMRTDKKQLSFVEFSSLKNLSALCPLINFRFDERVLKHCDTALTQSGPDLKSDKFWEEMDQAHTKSEKVEVLSRYLKLIACSALNMNSDEKLSETADLQELGFDSLMIIELKNSIQNLIGPKLNLTVNMLKNCNTIQLISSTIVSKLMEDEDEDGVPLEPLNSAELLELLRKDSQLPEEVRVAPETEPAVKVDEIKTVLMTGATGQFGPYLVAEIFKSYPSVEKIFCLVNDAKDVAAATEKLETIIKSLDLDEHVSWDKIECFPGNVAMENLGITVEQYSEFSKNMDAVIHLAAKTNLFEHLRPTQENQRFTDCRSVNILGTVNILKFACLGKTKRVFYASTLLSGIFGESNDACLSDNWPEANVIESIVEYKFPGLQTSKWICEMLMKQANQRGIPCKVFRLPWLAGESKTGRVDVFKNMYTLRFFTFLKLGAMPDTVVPATGLPVDVCAKIALKLFMNEKTPNEIFNVAHPHPLVEQEFVQLANKEFGKTVEVVEWKQFTERLNTANLQSEEGFKNVYEKLKMMSTHFTDTAGFGSNYVASPDTYFVNEKIRDFIPDFGKDLESTMETLARDLRFVNFKSLLNKL